MGRGARRGAEGRKEEEEEKGAGRANRECYKCYHAIRTVNLSQCRAVYLVAELCCFAPGCRGNGIDKVTNLLYAGRQLVLQRLRKKDESHYFL